MPPKAAKGGKDKGGKGAASKTPAKKKDGAGGGKAKKKKWSKGKVRDKLNNMVLFDKATYDKLYKEVVTYKLITPSVVSERLKVRASLAKAGLTELLNKNLIKEVVHHGSQRVYTRVTKNETENQIAELDIYRKVPKDLTQPTLTGALVHSELFVDDPEKEGRIQVKLDVLLPHMEYIGLDIQDQMGRHEVGFVENTVKNPTQDQQGCEFQATFWINKVPGNFHISTHSAQEQPQNPNMQHVVRYVIFGEDIRDQTATSRASFNPLKERTELLSDGLSTHEYIVKVVPSVYETLSGTQRFSYQYTYAHKAGLAYGHGGRIMPAIWFRYDMSPITVKYTERRQPFYTFLTTICAIVGGTFTVAGIIDSMLFTAHGMIKKMEIGKQG